MENCIDFASEWQTLQEEGRRLVMEAIQSQRKLDNMTQEPDLRELLEQKSRLRKQTGLINGAITGSTENVGSVLLECLCLCASDKKEKRFFLTVIKKSQRQLWAMERSGVPQHIIQGEKIIQEFVLWAMDAPIDEVKRTFPQQQTRYEQQSLRIDIFLKEANQRIEAIDAHYNRVKACLEQRARETQRLKEIQSLAMLNWATQDHAHLEWVIKNDPSRKTNALLLYQKRFPNDDVSELIPRLPPLPEPNFSRPKARHKNATAAMTETSKPDAKASPPWNFFVTFSADEQGQELTQDYDQFLVRLGAVLEKADYFNLDPKIVYNDLIAVTEMTLQQRQTIRKIRKAEPKKWKIRDIGEHRLFLFIDEKNRQIRFIPCPRREAYTNIHGRRR